MIVAMKKVAVVTQTKSKLSSLKALEEAGVLHLEELEGQGEKLASFKALYNKLLQVSAILGEVKLDKAARASLISSLTATSNTSNNKEDKESKKEIGKNDTKEASNTKNDTSIIQDAEGTGLSLSKEQVIAKTSYIIELTEKKKALQASILSYNSELERLIGWGEIDLPTFNYLKDNGVSIRLFTIPTEKFTLIDKELTTITLTRDKKFVRFLLVNAKEGRPEGLPPEAYEVHLPSISTKDIRIKIADALHEIENIKDTIEKQSIYKGVIASYKKVLEHDILFETVYSGMQSEEQEGALEGSKEVASPALNSESLTWITGYIPVDSLEKLRQVAAKNAWGLSIKDVEEDDTNVPTKLKNNRLVSLIYPLTAFLGTVPGYHEYDISGWFLLFFTIFFAMIFGDGGYGLLIVVAALVMKVKESGKKKNEESKEAEGSLSSLILLLGLATVVWGALTCTWFGLTPEQLPAIFTLISVPPISNAYSLTSWLPFWSNDVSKGVLTTAQNLQILCFTLAFLQLSVAHIKGIVSNKGSLKLLGEVGSLLQLWGMYYVVLSMVVSSSIFSFGELIYGVPIGTVSILLVAGGFALSFIFSNYAGNIGKSILESCKNIISVLLGVVNVFSDIVSYIRLWAVGLAGAAISNTVNTMAGPLLGHALMFIFFIILLVFGHGLNMILNLLSVIVHGVRLNTLEFSSHLGMSWSGFKYSPFSKKS